MIMPLQLLFDRLFKRLFWLVMISEAHNFLSKGFPRVLKSHIQEKNVRLLVAITSRLGKMLPFYNKKLRKKLQQEGLKVLLKAFQKPPLDNFRVSPLGLVPKKTSGEFRVIHDLSNPTGNSVNEGMFLIFQKIWNMILSIKWIPV